MEVTRLNRVSRLTAVSSAQASPRRLNVSRALFAAALVAVATALPAAATAPQSLIVPRLYAKVSASRISVTNQSGARVRLLQRNEYRIVVSDSTTAQNFHLTGPGGEPQDGSCRDDEDDLDGAALARTVRLSLGQESEAPRELRGQGPSARSSWALGLHAAGGLDSPGDDLI